jgi:hypothetical protein
MSSSLRILDSSTTHSQHLTMPFGNLGLKYKRSMEGLRKKQDDAARNSDVPPGPGKRSVQPSNSEASVGAGKTLRKKFSGFLRKPKPNGEVPPIPARTVCRDGAEHTSEGHEASAITSHYSGSINAGYNPYKEESSNCSQKSPLEPGRGSSHKVHTYSLFPQPFQSPKPSPQPIQPLTEASTRPPAATPRTMRSLERRR